MEYLDFERILSAKRMQRYKDAANGDTRKAMALYRYNLRLSQEMFTILAALKWHCVMRLIVFWCRLWEGIG